MEHSKLFFLVLRESSPESESIISVSEAVVLRGGPEPCSHLRPGALQRAQEGLGGPAGDRRVNGTGLSVAYEADGSGAGQTRAPGGWAHHPPAVAWSSC